MVKIEFKRLHEDQIFRDAIVLPDDHKLSDAEIEQIKDQRFADWIQSISEVSEE